MLRLLISALFLSVLTGCATSGSTAIRDVSEDQVRQQIEVGKTTREQVRKLFGSPFETTYTDAGLEIWKYQYDDTTALTKETVGSVIFTLGLAGGTSEGVRSELVILYDENDIVKRFNMSKSDVRTGTGFFK